jgi:rubrerythrin
MLELNGLSTQELSDLCRHGGQVCVSRFRQIAEAADPADRPLQELLSQMAKGADLQARAIPEVEEPSSQQLRPRGEMMELIRSYLTSLSKGFGEGRLHRDIALFLAESLEEEAARLYRTLAEHAREWRSRALFLELSECERGKLRFLREVVLQS